MQVYLQVMSVQNDPNIFLNLKSSFSKQKHENTIVNWCSGTIFIE